MILAFLLACAKDGAPAGSPPRFVELGVSGDFSCALDEAGIAVCWGDLLYWEAPFLPTEPLHGLNCGDGFCCALADSDNATYCWGDDDEDAELPEFESSPLTTALAVGSDRLCAVASDGITRCWGSGLEDLDPPMPEGLVQVAVGSDEPCGLFADGSAVCPRAWYDPDPEPELPDAPIASLDMFNHGLVALDRDGNPTFSGFEWGQGTVLPVGERFAKISLGVTYGYGDATCGVTQDQRLLCWGDSPYDIEWPPAIEEPVMDVDMGRYNACALLESGRITCWGVDVEGTGLLSPP